MAVAVAVDGGREVGAGGLVRVGTDVAVGITGVLDGMGVVVGPTGVFEGAGVTVDSTGVWVGARVTVGSPGVAVVVGAIGVKVGGVDEGGRGVGVERMDGAVAVAWAVGKGVNNGVGVTAAATVSG
jgi:hypothetical protein